MDAQLFPGMDDGTTYGQTMRAERGVVQALPRLRRPERDQIFWEACSLEERLPKDHVARTLWAVVSRLDLSAFEEAIVARGSDPGRAATDPRLLVALWLYATVDGVGNGRRLDRLCREHDAYRWLCGGVSLNYHTLNDFRVQHERALDALLTKVLVALVNKGVVKVDRISQDGKKVRASAGSSSFHREGTLREQLARTRSYIEELKKQADDAPADEARARTARERAAREKAERIEEAMALLPELERIKNNPRQGKRKQHPARSSTTDPDARKMMMPDGGVRPAFNVQVATDVASGAIVGVDVVQAGSDHNQSVPLREQVEQRTGQKVKEHLMDQGYVDMNSIEQAERHGVTVYAPLPKGKNGKPVTASRWDTEWTAAWRTRMQTPTAQYIYKTQRAATSERVNAELQDRLGLRRFVVRRLPKVRCIALWAALAFDVVHFARHLLG
jgi:transposase